MQESRFSSRNVQSARERPNLLAISAPGRVIVVQGSATPESGCTLTTRAPMMTLTTDPSTSTAQSMSVKEEENERESSQSDLV